MIKMKLFILFGLLAAGALYADDLQGKDIVRQGTYGALTGTLRSDGDEMYIDTAEGTFKIHKGPEWYSEEIGLTGFDGKSARVEGFIKAGHVSPTTVSLEGRSYTFRDREGKPGWAGRGNNRNTEKGDGNVKRG